MWRLETDQHWPACNTARAKVRPSCFGVPQGATNRKRRRLTVALWLKRSRRIVPYGAFHHYYGGFMVDPFSANVHPTTRSCVTWPPNLTMFVVANRH